MTRLLLIRHGETDWNRDRRIQGTTDIPLNDTGREQARQAALALRDRIDPLTAGVVSSDLSRAAETARIIAAELRLPEPQALSLLRERAYGDAEGLSIEELQERFGGWQGSPVPGAESPEHLRRRALRGLRRAVAMGRRLSGTAGGDLLVVAHGALIREVIAHASGGEFPIPGQRLPNASVSEIMYERDRMRLVAYSAV